MALSKTSDLQDLIKCPVCLDPFTDARQLPCLHIYCGQCLSQMTRAEAGYFPCPLCQKKVSANQEFPSCFFMNNLSEILSKKADHKRCCNFCFSEEWKEMFLCRECFRKICPTCKMQHEATTSHSFKSLVNQEEEIEKSISEDIREKSVEMCIPDHPDEKLEFYCDGCDVAFCIRCAVTKHRDSPCSRRELPKVGQEHRTRMYGVLADFTQRSNEYSSTLEMLDQGVNIFEDSVAVTLGEVEDQAEVMHAIIDKYKKNVLKSIEDTRCNVVQDLETTRQKMQEDQQIVRKHGKGIESMLQFGKTTAVIKSSLKEHDRFQNILRTMVPKKEDLLATRLKVNRPRIPPQTELNWNLEMCVEPLEESLQKAATEASTPTSLKSVDDGTSSKTRAGDNKHVIKTSKSVEFQTSFYPGGISAFSDGRLVVSENWGERVVLFNKAGKQQKVMKVPNGTEITDVTVYKDKNILAMNRVGKMMIFDASTSRLIKTLDLNIPDPSGICTYNEDIYVTAVGEGSIYNLKLNASNNPEAKINIIKNGQPVKLENPLYVAASQNQILVSNTGLHSAEIFNRIGVHSHSHGGDGERGSGNNQLNRNRGVAIDQNENLLIADSNNNRVVVLSKNFEFLGFLDIGSHTQKPACLTAAGGAFFITHGTWPNGPYRVSGYTYDLQ